MKNIIEHESAFGLLELNLKTPQRSRTHFGGIASCPMEALCFINYCHGGVIHDFCKQYDYDFTKHIGEKIEVAEDENGRYATFETATKTTVIKGEKL